MFLRRIRSGFSAFQRQVRINPQIITRSMASESGAYDGDGQTTVQVLGENEPHLNIISSYSNKGFRLQNNLLIKGSVLLFPTHIYAWAIRRGKDITPESLLIFDLIVPKLKMVIIGYGDKDEPYDPKLRNHFRNKGISCEILPTHHAISTYNFMVCDSVHVAGAFVPVIDTVKMTDEDNFHIHAHDQLYKNEWFPDYGHHRENTEYVRERYDNVGLEKKYNDPERKES